MFISNSVVGCVTIRKAAWEEVGGYDESMVNGNEDWDLWIRLLHAGHTGIQVREPLFRYRKHGVSMSVETEGSYESAIDDLPRRLPHIYNRSYLGERKSRDYPLLTVLSPLEVSAFRHATGVDFQHIDIDGSDPASAAPAIRGKYVVLWPEGAVAENSALERLCFALENEPDAGAAATTDDSPIVVVRTWSLHDPDGPQRQLATAVEGSADRRIAPSEWPDVAWRVPNEINGVAVQRQRPEEAGTIPDWVPA
jgi:hypothetical protein